MEQVGVTSLMFLESLLDGTRAGITGTWGHQGFCYVPEWHMVIEQVDQRYQRDQRAVLHRV